MEYSVKSLNKTIGMISMIIMPLMFTLSELIHPITMSTAAEEIISAGQNSTKWFYSHIFVLISLFLVPFLLLKLSEYIKLKHLRIYNILYVITLFGILATIGLLTFDFMVFNMGKIGASDDIINLYLSIQKSFYGYFFLTIGPALFLLGFLILSILMLLNKENKRTPVILIIIGILIYAFAGPLIPVKNGHIIVACGSFIMLTGFVLKLLEEIRIKK